MRHPVLFLLRLGLILALLLLCGWGWFKALVNVIGPPLAVYNSSNIVDQYWHFKNEHGSWPPPGEIFGYGDSQFVRSVPNAGGEGRADVFSFSRSANIVINLDWPDHLFASLEPPDSETKPDEQATTRRGHVP